MAVTDEALWAVAKNALRHLIEANANWRAQRFASALVSAVFAIEEAGKLSLLASQARLPSPRGTLPTLCCFGFWRARLLSGVGLGSGRKRYERTLQLM